MTIDDYLATSGKTAAVYAADAKISEASLTRIRRGEQNFSRDVLRRLIAASGNAVTANDLIGLPCQTHSFSDFNGHNDTVVEARTVLCATCELRTDDPATASCTFIDCPHSQRQAA
jgi:hypothetical protein